MGKPVEKKGMHPRNRHRFGYDFAELIMCCPELAPFVSINKYGFESVDFSNPEAVKTLNKALLKQFYGISNWDIPANYLCPPIPGRADYIHYLADLLTSCNQGVLPAGKYIRVLDIGVGANCVYPLIGNSEYGWHFTGSDIDPVALHSAKKIINSNTALKGVMECRLQTSSTDIFKNIIKPNDRFDLTLCNPPFHASLADANAGTARKWHNLNLKKTSKTTLNFGGKQNELWCIGGEKAFIYTMIEQSTQFPIACFWYSTLVSKKSNLPGIYRLLKKVNAYDVRTIEMIQGQKVSRIVTWTFLNKALQNEWRIKRWQG